MLTLYEFHLKWMRNYSTIIGLNKFTNIIFCMSFVLTHCDDQKKQRHVTNHVAVGVVWTSTLEYCELIEFFRQLCGRLCLTECETCSFIGQISMIGWFIQVTRCLGSTLVGTKGTRQYIIFPLQFLNDNFFPH